MFQTRAKALIYEYVKARLEKTHTEIAFTKDDIYVVWFNKALDHWKALLGTTLPDGMYYEVTHNGIKHETYIDAYMKIDNVCVPDPPPFDPSSHD